MFLMSVHSPNFFILDEPTNHLDMETIEALGLALQKFQVTVLFLDVKTTTLLWHFLVQILVKVKNYSATPGCLESG